MRLILTSNEMRLLEQRAFAQGAPSLLVMENAARAAHAELQNLLGDVNGKDILYLIGPGNNGGDGLAMARLCFLTGGRPRVLLTGQPKTPDALTNLSYVKALKIPILEWTQDEGESIPLPKPDAVVDAVYRTGFHGLLPPPLQRLAGIVNKWVVPVLAVDTPSGIDCLTGDAEGEIIRASVTVTLGHIKTGLCLCRRLNLIGELRPVSIGLPPAAYQALESEKLLSALEPGDLKSRLPKRAKNAHKGDCGRVLLYAGSMGMAGAAGMAAQAALACLRAGAGLVTIACEEEIIPILQALAPNAMCIPVRKAVSDPPKYDVFAVGCGLGQSEEIWNNIIALWQKNTPSVWDADALNMLARHPMVLGEKSVMTPHPGEAARLLGVTAEEVIADPLKAARALYAKYGGTVVLKGAVSVIDKGEEQALNLVGSPALAKGGSGDALTGIIAALIGQSPEKSPFEHARTGCLWHGMAAQEAARQLGVLSPLTSDVISCLGPVSLR